MKHISAFFAAIWIGYSGSAQAQSNPVVIELFTSQGCSSCPPADALMHKLAALSDVIALSLHVDYWDYIGWKDEFGRAENAARQRSYARTGGLWSVYTPQMIIAGEDSVVGTHPMDVADLIAKHSAKTRDVALRVKRSGSKISIAATSRNAGKFDVILVTYSNKRTSAIKRGENVGKTITYVNVVSDFKVIKKWDGRAPLVITAQVRKGPAVVLIQSANHGPIAAAAQIN